MKYGSSRRIGIPGVTEFQRAYDNFKSNSLNILDNQKSSERDRMMSDRSSAYGANP